MGNTLKPDEIVCHNRDGLTICAPFPWNILINKITIKPIHRNGVIASHISSLRKLVLKALGISVPRYENGLFIWGYFHEENKPINPNKCPLYFVTLTSQDWYMVLRTKLPRTLALVLSEIDRVVKFILVGGSGMIVNLVLAELVYRHISNIELIAKPIASTIGFEASVNWNFSLHELWTFKGVELGRDLKNVLKRLLKYHFASIASWASQATFSTLLPVLFKTSFILGQFIGIVIGFIVNFILGYIYTWSIHRIRLEKV
ncbi:MAG: GtrA family protein [Desulfurococcaceae archaeon]